MGQIPMLPQFYVGEGVSSVTGNVYGQAIDFSSVEPETTGQRVELALESVASSRELTEKLDINASASLSLGLFSASAEFKLANTASINSYYTYALVRVIVQNPPKVLRNPQLRGDARALLQQKGWDAFASAYGWEYVQGLITGGSYYALIEVQTNDETEQRDVKAKLAASYGPFKADASFQNTLQEATKNTVTRVIIQQNGGNGDLIETDLGGMLQQARSFPDMVKANPVTISALVAEYRATVPVPLDVPEPNSLALQQQRDTLEDLGRSYLRLRDYKRTLDFILSQQRLTDFDDFRDLTPEQLQQRRAAYLSSLERTTQELDKITVQAQRCATSYTQCQGYVSAVELLPLPRKGGELMNLKELEDKVAGLERQIGAASGGLDQLSGGQRPFQSVGLAPGATLRGAGRVHIAGEELLYLLNKSGVIIGKEWGGSGDLFVQGASRLGLHGTSIRSLQTGSQGAGNSNAGVKRIVVPFITPFEGVPRVIAIARGDGRRQLPDTLVVSVTDINNNEFAANVCRVDTVPGPTGWGQAVTIDWIAWE